MKKYIRKFYKKYKKKLLLFFKVELYYNIVKYFIYKIFYYIVKIKTLSLSFRFIHATYQFFIFLLDEISYDLETMENHWLYLKRVYYGFGVIKHILFILSLIFWVFPPFGLAYILFFFFKYMFRYIFVIIDYFRFPEGDYTGHKYYENIRWYILAFFVELPDFLKKIYRYIFKSRWTRYFLGKFKNYLIYRRDLALSNFFYKTDKFFLETIPKYYHKLVDVYDGIDLGYYMIKWFKFKKFVILWFRRCYILFWHIRRIIRKIIRFPFKVFRKIRKFYKRFWRIFWREVKKIYSKIYYKIYWKYWRFYCVFIWFTKKYMFSDAQKETIYAFYLIFTWNSRAIFYYFFWHIFSKILFPIIFGLHNTHERLASTAFYWVKFRTFLNWKSKVLGLNFIYIFSKLSIKLILGIIHFFFFWFYPLAYWNTDFWFKYYSLNHVFIRTSVYFMRFNVKIPHIVWKFFRKLDPTWTRPMTYDRHFCYLRYYSELKLYRSVWTKDMIDDIWAYIFYAYFYREILVQGGNLEAYERINYQYYKLLWPDENKKRNYGLQHLDGFRYKP